MLAMQLTYADICRQNILPSPLHYLLLSLLLQESDMSELNGGYYTSII